MLQILMPLAGSARPFVEQGQTFPKSLVEVRGRPLVEYAIGSVRPTEESRFLFVINAADASDYCLDAVLGHLAPGSITVKTEGPTAGALCSCLLATDHVDPALPLLIANGDQYLPDGIDGALCSYRHRDLDVGILTFSAVHPRWSFVRLDQDGAVVETAEKRPISSHATVGIYYYREAATFIRSAERTLEKNARHANQFFVSTSINELILEGCAVGVHHIDGSRFVPLGIPDDLDDFKERFRVCPLPKAA